VVIGEKTPSLRFARTFQDGPWTLCNSSNVVFSNWLIGLLDRLLVGMLGN